MKQQLRKGDKVRHVGGATPGTMVGEVEKVVGSMRCGGTHAWVRWTSGSRSQVRVDLLERVD